MAEEVMIYCGSSSSSVLKLLSFLSCWVTAKFCKVLKKSNSARHVASSYTKDSKPREGLATTKPREGLPHTDTGTEAQERQAHFP